MPKVTKQEAIPNGVTNQTIPNSIGIQEVITRSHAERVIMLPRCYDE